MGRPKQLLAYQGKPLVRRAAETALSASCDPVIVVTGAAATEVTAALQGATGIIIEHNAAWLAGMGRSIRSGVDRLLRESPNTCSAIVMLCDQPYVTADHLRQLMQVQRHEKKSIVATHYDDAPGVPCLFLREWFAALQQLPDRDGAKQLIAAAGDEVVTIPLPGAGVDIDTPADYQQLIKPS